MAATTTGQRLGIGIVAILLFLLVLTGVLGIVVLVIWPLWVLACVAATALILALPIVLIRRLVAGPSPSPARTFIITAVLTFLALSAVIAFPIYYFAYLVDSRPTMMPLVSLTNGKKLVQFQGMQHIGSEGFYKSVVYDLREALDRGYKLFYEGVRPVDGRPDLTAFFNAIATDGSTDLSVMYKTLADGCGIQFQLDYFKGLTADMPVHPDRHLIADVTYLELKNEYDRLMKTDPAFASEMGKAVQPRPTPAKPDIDPMKGFLGLWQNGTPDQRRLLGLVCRGFFSWSFSQPAQALQKDKLILDFRNVQLARSIADAKEDRIWITYGARHITGVISELKKIDPAWRVERIKWSRVIANPDDHQGELR